MAARNPRRIVLEALREMSRLLRPCLRSWDQSQTTYDVARAPRPDGSGYYNNAVYRPRRDDERIENDPGEWQRLADYATVLEVRAGELRRFAYDQRREAMRRRDGR